MLELLLRGSESLWGMVDWENYSCDFNTPLFGKQLEATVRCGDSGRKALGAAIMENTLIYVNFGRKMCA